MTAMSASLNLQGTCAGFYKIEAITPDGTRRVLADWFPNLITNGGLDRMGGNSSYLVNCYVGSGSSTPNPDDSSLDNFVAANNSRTVSNGAQSTAPYYGRTTSTYRFNAGVAAGNISEVGVGWSQSGLYSRALILDAGGNPTTITVLSDEVLDVTYQIRTYPPADDVSGQIELDGILHDWVARASLVNNSDVWGVGSNGFDSGPSVSGGLGQQRVSNGMMGSITEDITGSISGRTSVSSASYQQGSLQRSATATWGLDSGNVGGVSAMRFPFNWCSYQFSFDPPIPKDNTKILQLTVTHSWTRRTL